MFNVNDDAKGSFHRVEILSGPGRRRRWSADQKARIVSETLEPGARVAEVARRWQLCSQQLFGWRRAARRNVVERSTKATAPIPPDFVPIVTDPALTVAHSHAAATKSVIEIALAGAVVRVGPGMDDRDQLTAVLRAVRASASRT